MKIHFGVMVTLLATATSVSVAAPPTQPSLQERGGAEASSAGREVVLYTRDLLLANDKLDSAQRQRLESIKAGTPELNDLAAKFDKTYLEKATTCHTVDACLSAETIRKFRDAVDHKDLPSQILRPKTDAQRRAADFGDELWKNAPRIDPRRGMPGWPWCLFWGC